MVKKLFVLCVGFFVNDPMGSLAVLVCSMIVLGMFVTGANHAVHEMYLEWHPELRVPSAAVKPAASAGIQVEWSSSPSPSASAQP